MTRVSSQADNLALSPRTERFAALRRLGSPTKIGGLYVLGLVIIIFSVWVPNTFDTWSTLREILNGNATTGIVAFAVVVPLAAGVFDLSVGATLGLTSLFTAKLLVETHLSVGVVIVLMLLVAVAVGLLNALVVVVLKIDSFIGTLGTQALISAVILMLTNNQQVSSPSLVGAIRTFAVWNVFGYTGALVYLLVIAVVVWWILETTPMGRRIYATGFNPEVARLTGVNVNRIKASSLVVSALLSGFAGILVTGQVGSGQPTVGPPYLLPAFAIAFVGATQIKPGRFNALGTIVAIVLIGTGTVGLSLTPAPLWAPQIYLGVVLIVAIGITGYERRAIKGRRRHDGGRFAWRDFIR
jgi:ribose/xylose/arabinose/galactoside ABC-type transport system permease subunit